MKRRFLALKRAVRQFVVVEDCFGLEERHPFVIHGGPGSGNFGHEGRPGQVGGSGAGGGFAFHGTSGEFVESIRQTGIRPSSGALGVGVYAADAEIGAVDYALSRAKSSGATEVAIIVVDAEPFETKSGEVYFTRQAVPADKIREIRIYNLQEYQKQWRLVKGPNDPFVPPPTKSLIKMNASGVLYIARLIWGKQVTANAERQVFRFQTTSQKMKSFQRWFKGQVKKEILSTDSKGKPWTDKYVDSAYRQATVRSYTDVHPEAVARSKDFFQGGKDQFLRSAFAAPERVSKIELLYTRTFDQLEGITEAMGQEISRTLSSGLAEGRAPLQIAKEMAESIDGIERKRAEAIARTEIIHAHAEGMLDAFEDLGVEEVGIEAEWSTAGDEVVCKLCDPLDGVVMKVEEARGLLPRHVNCRCSWTAALRDEKEPEQKRGKKADAAMEASVEEEGGEEKSTWAGKEDL
jgi:SPP1 gp7 family putative phage head morphogenesis protein